MLDPFIDHVPPGETLQIGWRWREPGASQTYRFLINGPAFAEKTRPTKLDPGGSYSGQIPAALVMSSGGGAQPLTLHLTIHDGGGVWSARLIDPATLARLHYISENINETIEAIIEQPLRDGSGLRMDWLQMLHSALEAGKRW